VKRFCIVACLAVVAIGVAVFAAVPSLAAGWDGHQRLTINGPLPFAAAGNEHGRRVIAWADYSGVFLTVAPRGHRFGAEVTVSSASQNSGAQLAVDERGDIAITWLHYTDEKPATDLYGENGCCNRLMGAVLRRDGHLSRPVALGVRGQDDSDWVLSANGSGHVGVAFRRNGMVYARFGTMRGGFGRVVRMSDESGIPMSALRGRVIYSTYDESRPTVESVRDSFGSIDAHVILKLLPSAIGFDDKGRQTAVWQTTTSVMAATRKPPGNFGSALVDRPGNNPVLGVAGAGPAVMAWQLNGQVTRVFASVRRAGSSGFSAPLQLDGLDGDFVALMRADAADDGSSAVGLIHRTSSNLDEARVYLVSRKKAKPRMLVAGRDALLGDMRVLRDARGTLAVVATHSGLRAVWKR
jgi:hypothetical protein